MTSLFNLFTEIKIVLSQGGPVLWVMMGLSVILYGLIISTWIGLYKVKQEVHSLDESKVSYLDEKSIGRDVAIFELDRFAWVQRRLPMIAVLVAAAPLSGLLGTVFGMFVTFNGLASQAAARPIDSISMGISSAMITTQAGLFMAIPGAILLAFLRSQTNGVEGYIQQKMYEHMSTMKGTKV
ncbi:MAG: MotA/TolQ/ExbB proton channel family protein [Akkermansiaceae bacterium]